MLESVSLRDLGVIVAADVECGPALTVITGETGAGKTMLLTGLGLLWGDRADPARVRLGSTQARVDGVIRVSDAHLRQALQEILDESGGQWDEDSLIVSRTVSAEGRSRAHLGGRTVPAGVLAEVAGHLVAVHGQDDQRRLLSARHQREALDAFAGDDLGAALTRYRGVYEQLKAAIQRRAELTEEADDRRREAEGLRELVSQIADVDPQPGETQALREEASRLAHIDQIAAALATATALLRADTDESGFGHDVGKDFGQGSSRGVEVTLGQARSALAAVSQHDATIGELLQRIDAVSVNLAEIVVDLAAITTGLESDPQRLDHVEERRARLAGLLRRVSTHMHDAAHRDLTGSELDEQQVLEWVERARSRLAELDDDPEQIAELHQRIDDLRSQAAEHAEQVSQLRRAAAVTLSARVTEELAGLAMPRARLQVMVRPRPAGEGLALQVSGVATSGDRHGVDDIAFEFAAHDDDEPRPLGKGASGGERSRIMLALEVVLAGADPVPTMVFDEVDAGVGGRAAVEVGRRLARLAQHTQVLVVTHLPQVAAFADRHLVVRAGADGQVTQASIEAVEGEQRHRELARMLAGLEDSETAMAHAAELLDVAAAEATSSRDTPAGRGSGSARR